MTNVKTTNISNDPEIVEIAQNLAAAETRLHCLKMQNRSGDPATALIQRVEYQSANELVHGLRCRFSDIVREKVGIDFTDFGGICG